MPTRLSAGVAIDQLRLALKGNVWYLDGGWQTLVDGLRAGPLEMGARIRTGARVKSVRGSGDGVIVQTAAGEVLQSRAAVVAVAPKTACDLLELPARGTAGAVDGEAACPSRQRVSTWLSTRLDRPGNAFALGLDRPFYFSVHSAAAKLAPEAFPWSM